MPERIYSEFRGFFFRVSSSCTGPGIYTNGLQEGHPNLLRYQICMIGRWFAQLIGQEYLWTSLFTPRPWGDTTGPNKAGFLLHEGKA